MAAVAVSAAERVVTSQRAPARKLATGSNGNVVTFSTIGTGGNEDGALEMGDADRSPTRHDSDDGARDGEDTPLIDPVLFSASGIVSKSEERTRRYCDCILLILYLVSLFVIAFATSEVTSTITRTSIDTDGVYTIGNLFTVSYNAVTLYILFASVIIKLLSMCGVLSKLARIKEPLVSDSIIAILTGPVISTSALVMVGISDINTLSLVFIIQILSMYSLARSEYTVVKLMELSAARRTMAASTPHSMPLSVQSSEATDTGCINEDRIIITVFSLVVAVLTVVTGLADYTPYSRGAVIIGFWNGIAHPIAIRKGHGVRREQQTLARVVQIYTELSNIFLQFVLVAIVIHQGGVDPRK